jgi:hypothetical protein
VALPVIDYAGGRSCMPLWAPLVLLPAEIVPLGIGFLAAIILVLTVIKSSLVRRHQLWAVGALTIVVAATLAFAHFSLHFPGFLHGLRDRFVMKVGYPKMREFAKEMARTGAEAMIARPGTWNPVTTEDQKRWDDLVARYPFLDWNDATGTVLVRDGIVQLTWGSALVGHRGFQVGPEGTVRNLEKGRGAALRVSGDIQFVYTD